MAAKKIGRPKGFDEQSAVEAAMRVFWKHGFDGASTAMLANAIGIGRSSLYATFGDKQSLFLRAVKHYAQGPARYVAAAVELTTARDVVHALLDGVVNLHSSLGNPRGCLLVQGAIATSPESERVRETMVAYRKAGERLLEKRFRQAQEDGDLPREVNPGDLARYLGTVLNGIGVQAANGASASEMRRVAQIALKAFPRELQ